MTQTFRKLVKQQWQQTRQRKNCEQFSKNNLVLAGNKHSGWSLKMKQALFTPSSNYLRTQHLPCALAVKPYSLLGTLWILPRASPCWDEGWDCPGVPSSTPWQWLISREVVKQGTVFDCQCYRKRGDGQGPWLFCCRPKGKGFVEEVKVFLKGSVSFVVFSIREKWHIFFLLLITLYFLLCTKYKNANPKSTDQ